jgi:hypothetical protein
MNDPGLDEPIANEAEAVERFKEEDEEDEAEEDAQSFLAPRYVPLWKPLVRSSMPWTLSCGFTIVKIMKYN